LRRLGGSRQIEDQASKRRNKAIAPDDPLLCYAALGEGPSMLAATETASAIVNSNA
jgi:hypothetical protein